MKLFQLSVKAISDLRAIAVFTQRRWGREQRNIDTKQFDETREGYRKFPLGSRVIFYKQTVSQQIQGIRILHKRMDVSEARILAPIQASCQFSSVTISNACTGEVCNGCPSKFL